MKKILITFKVKNVNSWLSENTLEQLDNPSGIKVEFFVNTRSNLVGYVANIPDAESLDDILLNTTILSDLFKSNGVSIETYQILESMEI
jgi:hypothetical protein